jgi:hypothetical protein
MRELLQLLKLGDHSFNDRKASLPEGGVAGVETERGQQLGVVLGSPSRKHIEVAFREAFIGALVDGVEGIHEAIAESVGVDIKWGMHKVGNVGPKHLIAGLELDRGPQALMLDVEPERVEPLGGELAVSPFGMKVALEKV